MMKSWRATEFGEIKKVLKLTTVAVPKPQVGQVLIKVNAAGVALPDVLMTKGLYPVVPKPPVSPGQEVVGEIAATTPGSTFQIGDPVIAITAFDSASGGLSEYCLASELMTVPRPTAMTTTEAAGFLVASKTAYVGLAQRAHLQAGETLLVLGASGSSGSMAIQLGKVMGATVIALASSNDKQAFCQNQGADHVLDYRARDLCEQIMAITDGKGVDVVFDPVGGDLGTRVVPCIANHGRFCLIGFASGHYTEIDPQDMILRNYAFVGACGYLPPDELIAQHKALLELANKGSLKTPIAAVYKFEDALSALDAVEHASTPGKFIVEIQ